jgi:flagellar biosynthesis/type III secretory pathway protein FliH
MGREELSKLIMKFLIDNQKLDVDILSDNLMLSYAASDLAEEIDESYMSVICDVSLDQGYENGHSDGYDEGFDDGRDEGYSAGHEIGYEEGYDIGYDDGKDIGYEAARVMHEH